jgi:hypothetical protein
MAQPGNFTPILLYSSSTSTNVPLAANLTNSANGAEIAINIADKNLFFKDSGGTVNTVPIRQSSTSSNGWLSSTDWNTFNNKAPATSGTSLLYGNGSGGFSNVTIGSGITFVGGTLSATGSGGTVTSVTGTSPVVSSGGTTPAISLATAYGDTLNPYASKTANYFLGAPNGSAGVPTFRALVVADVTGLGTMATQNANAVAITGGSINGTTIGATTQADITGNTISAFTKFVATDYYAQSITGGNLRTSGGTSLLNWDGGGSGNVTINGGLLANPANKNVSLAPTGTGSVTINPATAGTINNMVIGGTTPLAITGTTITATTFVGSGASLTGVVTSVTGTAPVVSSGGTTPAISMAAATSSVNGYLTSADWTTFNNKQPAGSYLTAVSVVSANGFAGTSSGGTTPALTLSTSITGILKGNGTAISAATSGTDYAPATSGSSILYGNGAGGFSNVTVGTGLTFIGGTLASTASGGTVTSVAALTLGTTGTDLSSTVANSTTTPVITLNVPTASATNRGALSSADWSTFNGKAPGVTFTSKYVPYGQGTTTLNQSSALQFDGTNLSIGGAASAWSGAGNVLQLTSGAIWGSTAVSHHTLNTYFDGTNYKYIGTDFATDYYQLSGTHVWRTAVSGTAGNTVSFTERMRISSSNLLLGTTTNYATLGASVQIVNSSGLGQFAGGDASSATTFSFGRDNVTTGNFVFAFNGAVVSSINAGTGIYTPLSDSRVKKNIAPLQYGLNEILNLNPVVYNMVSEKDTDKKHIGLIAQEVKSVMDETVDDLKNQEKQMYGLDKSVLVPVLINAIQELNAKFEAYVASHP